jgi:hypothetical protein
MIFQTKSPVKSLTYMVFEHTGAHAAI